MSSRRRQRGQIRPNRRLWNLGQRPKARTRRFRWIRKIPFKLLLVVVALFLGFEILTLPFVAVARLPSKNPPDTALMQQRIEEGLDLLVRDPTARQEMRVSLLEVALQLLR